MWCRWNVSSNTEFAADFLWIESILLVCFQVVSLSHLNVRGFFSNVKVNGGHTEGSVNLVNTCGCPLQGLGSRRQRPRLFSETNLFLADIPSTLSCLPTSSTRRSAAGVQVKILIPLTAGDQVLRRWNPKRNKRNKRDKEQVVGLV